MKKSNNPLIKRNEYFARKEKQHHREEMIKGTKGNAVFNFLRDFSSSDYEEFTSVEINRRKSKRKNNNKPDSSSKKGKNQGTPGEVNENSYLAGLEDDDKVFKRKLFTMEFSKFAQREVCKVRTDAHKHYYKRYKEDGLKCTDLELPNEAKDDKKLESLMKPYT